MGDKPTWQTQAVQQLSQIFERDAEVRAFVLNGSLADAAIQTDIWSDVDAQIILADHALERYYASTEWLAPLGRLLGAERYKSPFTRTLRVCLEGVQRFDLTFIAEAALQTPSLENHHLFKEPFVVLWSRWPDLASRLHLYAAPAVYQDIAAAELASIIDAFWFKAAVALAKVGRNDLLIALHLALDLVRDTLLLQMIRRDREQQTTRHRFGGWGNELVGRFTRPLAHGPAADILDLIQLSGEIFDELAAEVQPDYEPRLQLLWFSIESAKQNLE